MGIVTSILHKNNRVHTHDDDPVEIQECCICYERSACNFALSCGHKIHAGCVTRWWIRNPAEGLCCPMCRTRSYDCYIEIAQPENKPAGYYRQDSKNSPIIMLRRCGYEGDSQYVRLPEIGARDLALSGFVIYFKTGYQAEVYTNLST